MSGSTNGNLGVDGIYRLTVTINGEFPDASWALGYLRVWESISYPLPVATIVFTTSGQYYNEIIINENDAITIEFTPLKTIRQETEKYFFKVFNINHNYEAPFRKITITLITDSPNMLIGYGRILNSTSAEVFQTIGEENDFFMDDKQDTTGESTIDSSNDSQIWQQLNKRTVIWATDVCNHAYLNETSHYMWAATRHNTLYFVNMDERKNRPVKWVFDHPKTAVNFEDNVMPYGQIQYRITSGMQNRAIGYGSENISHDFSTGQGVTFDPNTYHVLSDSLLYDISQRSVNRSFSLASNIGNDHPFYASAQVQNYRFRAMYSTAVRLATEFPLNASLFDMCDLKVYDSYTNQPDQIFTQKYFIGQIETRIGGSYIYRYFELLTDGLGMNNVNDNNNIDSGLTDI